MRLVLLCVVALVSFVFAQDEEFYYSIPRPSLRVMYSLGFDVSIPDDDKISSFSFMGSINRRHLSEFNVNVSSPNKDRWNVTLPRVLQKGDVIYYVIGVTRKTGRRFRSGLATFTVEDEQLSTITATWVQGSTRREDCSAENENTNCDGKLIFFEKFDNLSRWQKEIKFGGAPDYEFVIYTDDSENLYIDDRGLHIKPTLTEAKYGTGFVRQSEGLDLGNNCTGRQRSLDCKRTPFAYNILPPILSSRINTRESFRFLYGRIDIRAKLPKGDWIYPELLLTPKRLTYGPGYDSGEMRIAFVLGNAIFNQDLQGGLILGDNEKGRTAALRKKTSSTGWSDDFHVFSLIWAPASVTVLVDDDNYGNIYPPITGFGSAFVDESNAEAARRWDEGDILAPFDEEMVITIGVGVGGHSIPDSEFKPYKNEDAKEMANFYRAKNQWRSTWTVKDSELIIDYINVFKL